jgi:hypothetical protein
MLKVILKVLVALVVLAYGALFLSWNMTPQEITGLHWLGGVRYSQTLPVGSLVFIGLIAGAAIMAVAAWSAWAAQKAIVDKATAVVKKAKVKLQAQLDEINDLRAEIERLQGEISSLQAGDGTWGKVSAADLEAGTEGVAAPGSTPAAPEAEVDDPDVI